MFITQESDYAVRIVDTLARHPGGRMGAKAISEQACVTLRFSLKILRKLVASGIVRSYKGAQGGYAMARPLEEVSLYDLVCTLDGPFRLNRCENGDYECSRMGDKRCQYHDIFTSVSEQVQDSLKKMRIADLIDREPKTK